MSDAYYRLDLELDFVGSGPSKVNRAAPEVSRICAVAVAAANASLRTRATTWRESATAVCG